MGLISRFLKSKVKGFTGELKTDLLLGLLNNTQYKIINNFMAEVNGKSCQIDHLIVSPYGLFVVETKNYSGWIFASEYNSYWTQVYYKRKNKLYNPIKQNMGHINVLKHFLKKYSKLRYIPIIVFSSEAIFKTEVPSNVVYYSELVGKIKSFSTENITESEVKEIYDILVQTNKKSVIFQMNHVKNVKKTLQEKEMKINSGVCPICGGKLIMRNGKYGTFYGCNNYPKCRFSRKL